MENILPLIWIHYLSDFLMQPRLIAEGKSTNTKILMLHCVMYATPFLYFGVEFAAITALLHFLIDWPTSRLIRYSWYGLRNKFLAFALIGLDQALHLTCLYYTERFLL